jgi:uncharacterized protein (TIGR03000 family)
VTPKEIGTALAQLKAEVEPRKSTRSEVFMFTKLFAMSRFFLLAAVAMILAPQPGKAQIYDAFTVLRLPDRTIYFYPQGYAPSAAFYPAAFDAYRIWPYNPYPAPSSPFAATSYMPLSYESPLASSALFDNTTITVRVPANAEVWMQGKKMSETGTERRFTLPALDPQATYDYDVRVTWSDNGRKVSDDHHLKIRAGDHQSITLIAATTKNQASSANNNNKK